MTDTRPWFRSLIFEVTPRCNHTCRYCYNVWRAPGSEPHTASPIQFNELDTAQTLALLEKTLDQTRCRHVSLTGGEPLLRNDLPQILKLLQNRGVQATIISNGHLLTERAVVELLNRGVGLFELPLLSHRREVHDYLSGSPGAFDAVLSAMTHIRYHNSPFVAVFVATRFNLADLHETIKLAFAFGARALMFNRFNPGGRGQNHLDELLPSVGQIRTGLAVADAASAEFKFPIFCPIPIQPCLVDTRAYRHLSFGFCAAGSDSAYYTIDPLGNLRPCNHTSTVLGNLLEEPLIDLIAPERLALFLEAVPSICDPCVLRDTCQGGCKAAAQACYGSLTAEEPFLRRNRADATPLAAR